MKGKIPHLIVRCTLYTLFVFSFAVSCKPRIYSFIPSSQVITQDDSVQFTWDVRGKATLLFDQRNIARPNNDSLHVLEFTLVVKKGSHEAHQKVQISVVPKQTTDYLVFPVTSLNGDTLIASGVKDTMLWKGFSIASITSVNQRVLTVIHDDVQSVIEDTSTASIVWRGKPYSGTWIIKTLLTPAERNNHDLIPNRFQLKASIYKK